MLNEKEKKKYEIIEKVINGLITKKEAMVELNLTRQQIYRLVIKYHADGEIGFSHKNKNKTPVNKKDENLIKELEKLYLEKCYDFNFEHFYEKKILGNYDISYDVMLKRFTEDDIIINTKACVKNESDNTVNECNEIVNVSINEFDENSVKKTFS